ncbi:Uncharacterised protein [Vibrio cholerae]|nr:Uncharacterised protein [Vibrio cholerae]CSI53285.1 Uncharacterised protein [Vibrio cholerae]
MKTQLTAMNWLYVLDLVRGMNCHPHQATYYPMMFLGQMSI